MGQVRYFDFAYLFPKGHILIKLLFSVGLSLAGTYLFVKLINLIRVKEVIFVPLLGIMIGGIVSSFTTFIALRTNALQSIGNWMNGNFAIITSGRYEVLYLVVPYSLSLLFLRIILRLLVWGKTLVIIWE